MRKNLAHTLLHDISEIRQFFLYHATSYNTLFPILLSGELRLGVEEPYVSFSRSPISWHSPHLNKCRLVFSGEKLTQRYRLTPHTYSDDYGKSPLKRFEYELVSKKPITNIERYLRAIEFLGKEFIERYIVHNLYLGQILEDLYPDVRLYYHKYTNDPPKEFTIGYKPIVMDKSYHIFQRNIKESSLFESHVGLLYHATQARKIPSILQNDMLSSGSESSHISFSRQPSFWYGESRTARLILDGTRISHNYKLDPYVGGSKTPGYIPGNNLAYMKGTRYFEYEVELRGRSLKNLRRYLLGIEFSINELTREEVNEIDKALFEFGYTNLPIFFSTTEGKYRKKFPITKDYYQNTTQAMEKKSFPYNL